jgi:CRISPR-associated protein Csy2
MSARRLLILPQIQVQKANALSSPFSVGFPAMTAWLGFTHALQRKLNQADYDELRLIATAVVSHEFDMQAHKGEGDYVYSLIGTANPLDKDGSRSSFIEEPSCHLTVSLVIEWQGNQEELLDETDEFIAQVEKLMHSMKLASGNIQSFAKPEIITINTQDSEDFQKLKRRLMPGYLIIERRDLMIEAMTQQQNIDALDAMLSYLTVNHSCIQKEVEPQEADESQKAAAEPSWISQRKVSGWLVPIATGFQGVSELGFAQNQRDPNVLHRFAESVVTLAEFVMPHRIQNLDEMLWHYHIDEQKNLYLCQQKNQIKV